jgi:hypothetical protein
MNHFWSKDEIILTGRFKAFFKEPLIMLDHDFVIFILVMVNIVKSTFLKVNIRVTPMLKPKGREVQVPS